MRTVGDKKSRFSESVARKQQSGIRDPVDTAWKSPGFRLCLHPGYWLFARSVLERKVDGRVWVHRDATGAPALVWVAHPYGMSLLFGDAAQASPAALQAMLR